MKNFLTVFCLALVCGSMVAFIYLGTAEATHHQELSIAPWRLIPVSSGGIHVLIDPQIGCHYVVMFNANGFASAITPRLDIDGGPVCEGIRGGDGDDQD